jgi:hypothetical protein
MKPTSIRYRGYQIIIQSPDDPADRCGVVIWPPGKRAPIPMPSYVSEDAAIRVARRTVDQLLDSTEAPPEAI